MAKPQTAPARLDLLLKWLNGFLDEHVWGPNPTYGHLVYGAGEGPEDFAVRTDYSAIRDAVAEFVRSFDGTAGAGHLEVVADQTEPVTAPTDEELSELEASLHILLEQGFDGPGDPVTVKFKGGEFNTTPVTLFLPATSLRFAVRSARRQKPRVDKMDVTEKNGSPVRKGLTKLQRAYRAAGAYVLQVHGPTVELVPFLVAHLLTQADMVTMKRCRRSGCTHLIATARRRGAPKQFCNAACREWSRELEKQRKQKRRKR